MITIIILIILSTVTINAVLGDNGLIDQAKTAKNIAEKSIEDESEKLNDLSQEFANLMSEDETIDIPKFPIPPGGSVTEEGVPIPNGFYYVGGTKNDGVVISDNPADENQGAEHDKVAGMQGNQFVWVPVENPSDYFIEETVKLNGVETTTNVYSKLTIRDGDSFTSVKPGDTSSVREPDVLSSYDTDAQYYQDILGYGSTKLMADSFVQEYTEMYESIKKYGGFYIGRYETGDLGKDVAVVRRMNTDINYQTWYTMYEKCKKLKGSNKNVQTGMIWGNQYDRTLMWLIESGNKTKEQVISDSKDWGNYYNVSFEYENNSGSMVTKTGSTRIPTGSSEFTKANNIYDLAGNVWDWTAEAYRTGYRVLRRR